MTKFLIAFKALSVTFFFTITPAQALDGNTLKQNCEDGFKEACVFYIAGVHDTLVGTASEFYRKTSVRHPVLYCIPSNVTYQQFADIVVKYMRENPEILHHSGDLVVLSAGLDTFPCP